MDIVSPTNHSQHNPINKVLRKENHYIIGIGASAGGLEAIHDLFDRLPNNSVFSYIIVQHLSPDYKSLMAELLTRHTKMNVSDAIEGVVIQPNSVYVIPSKKNMTIKHGRLRLTDKPAPLFPNNAIDIFLESLAEDKGPQSIAIILSGTGSDGTKGIKAIKRAGGLVVVQDPVTAKFDGMPNSAIASGQVDLILPPELMGEELLNYVTHGSIQRASVDLLEQENESILLEILQLIKTHTSHDFTAYKRHTLSRRIFKRMAHLNIDSIQKYLDYLYTNQLEVIKLGQEFLIGVTRFFRDFDAFEIIRKDIIPEILKNKNESDTIKFWVVACSTGEEAYSLAMLVQDYFDQTKKELNVKIFATDVDLEAVEFAAKGAYPLTIEKDVPGEFLEKYLIKEGDKFVVNQHIRKMVIFAHHNIIKDPPFSKMDLVSCRNLLIYMNPYLQKRVLSILHFSLNKGGYLFLGSSENAGDLKNSITEVSKKWNIFKNEKCSKNFIFQSNDPFTVNNFNKKDSLPSHSKSPKNLLQAKMGEAFTDTILEEFGHAGIYIDEEYNILQAIGNYKDFLELPDKKLQLNLLKLVPHDLSVALSVAVRKAVKNDQKISTKNVRIKTKNHQKLVNIVVQPYISHSIDVGQKFILIILTSEKVKKLAAKDQEIVNEKIHHERLADLENELRETRENLHSAVEELETSNEELQSSNEELLSSNEELQSTNEELQSLNEELHTVNTEHQLKIKELIELNDDFNNYFRSTEIGQIFIDKNLIIRKYTPAVVKQINIIPTDIGRPINHFRFNIKGENLIQDILEVIHTSKNIEKEVALESGNIFLMKIIPYIRQDKNTDGVVITFVDITKVKQLTNIISGVLNSSLNSIMALKSIKNNANEIVDFEWIVVNEATQKILKKSSKKLIGKRLTETFPGMASDGLFEKFRSTVRTGEIVHIEHNYQHEGIDAWLEIVGVKIDNGIAVTINDISEKKVANEKIISAYEDLKKAEEDLKKLNNDLEKRVEERTNELSISEERFRLVSLATNDAILDWNIIDNKVWWNESFKIMFGYKASDLEEGIESLLNRIHVEEKDQILERLNKIIDSGEKQWSDEFRYLKADGSYAFVLCRSYILHNEKGIPYRMLGSMVDVTSLKKVQEELKHSNENLLKINNDLDNFVYTASHDLKSPIANLQSLIYHLKNRLKDNVAPDAEKLLELIDLSVSKFNETIQALTEITKVQKDQLVNIEKVKFAEVLEDVKRDLANMINENKAEIIANFEVENLYIARINLRSIMYNLISNAIKYRSPERPPVIELTSIRSDKHIILTVRDNGLGLNESQQQRLFTMFKRFHTHVDGTGIGLYIVKRIVENKEGQIFVESEKGKGTAFKVHFVDEKKKYEAQLITA